MVSTRKYALMLLFIATNMLLLVQFRSRVQVAIWSARDPRYSATQSQFGSSKRFVMTSPLKAQDEIVRRSAAWFLKSVAKWASPAACGSDCKVFMADNRILEFCFEGNRFDDDGICLEHFSAIMNSEAGHNNSVILGVKSESCRPDCVAEILAKKLSPHNRSFDLVVRYTLVVFSRRGNWTFAAEHGQQDSSLFSPRAFFAVPLIKAHLPFSIFKSNKNANRHRIRIPANLQHYLWQWQRSLFRECSDSAKAIRQRKLENGIPKTQIADNAIEDFAYLRDLMIQRGTTPMLTGGTLLGWLRECGIIDRDSDLDMVVLWEEAKHVSLSDVFFDDKRTPLCRAMELPGRPYEYTVTSKTFRIADVFFFFPDVNGSVTMESVNIDGGEKLRWNYPSGIKGVCSVDLYGELFHIACNAEDYVRETYGNDWMVPKPKTCWWCTPNLNVTQILSSDAISEVYTFCTFCGGCDRQRNKTARPMANSRMTPQFNIQLP